MIERDLKSIDNNFSILYIIVKFNLTNFVSLELKIIFFIV